jgi:DNA-binding transcriptional ArsR family regulator
MGYLMLTFMNITKALADENRVRILMALQGHELCVCQIIDLLQLAPSTVSKHLSILKQARLVKGRKAGRWIYYRLADTEKPRMIPGALQWVAQALQDQRQIQKDAEQLAVILQKDLRQTCGP